MFHKQMSEYRNRVRSIYIKERKIKCTSELSYKMYMHKHITTYPMTPANARTTPISVKTVAGISARIYSVTVNTIRRSVRFKIEESAPPSCARLSKRRTTQTCLATNDASGYVANIVMPKSPCDMKLANVSGAKLFKMLPRKAELLQQVSVMCESHHGIGSFSSSST